MDLQPRRPERQPVQSVQEAHWDLWDNFSELVGAYTDRLSRMLAQLSDDTSLAAAAELVWSALASGRDLFVAGNGGSATTATHIAADLTRALADTHNQLDTCGRVRTLVDNGALLTAFANDLGFEDAFAGQLLHEARPGDVLMVLSVSGNSANIVRACAAASLRRLEVIALLGVDGDVAPLASVRVVLGETNYGRVEDVHLSIGHILATYVRRRHLRHHA